MIDDPVTLAVAGTYTQMVTESECEALSKKADLASERLSSGDKTSDPAFHITARRYHLAAAKAWGNGSKRHSHHLHMADYHHQQFPTYNNNQG